MIVYPGVQPRTQLCDEFHKRFPWGLFGNSASSWVDSDLFVSWLENGFMKSIKERGMTLPVLLLIDRAKSHLSIHMYLSSATKMISFSSMSCTPHLIQLMDLVLMNCIKTIYKEEVCISGYRRILVSCLTSILLYKCLEMYRNKLLVKRTVLIYCLFERSGIFPWNPQMSQRGKIGTSFNLWVSRPTTRDEWQY